MQKLTEKDKIFLRVLPPLALLAAYGWLEARPLHRDVTELRRHIEFLGSEEMLQVRGKVLADKLEEAKRRLQEVEAAASAATEANWVVSAEEDDATRLRRVCDLLLSCGVKIISCNSEMQTTAEMDSGSKTCDLLRQVGVARPSQWRITFEAPYPAVVDMLAEIARRKIAVIPESVAMQGGGDGDKPAFWTLTVTL